ncbi:MoaD/ThiS family protein [Amycolatopsis rhizosphaerae]|uniref:MoaD/ThiS family protein n=1 Tax=Amycolatopsis rhizosphaerae TaxID=2053003 RepID=A0A558DKF2_9PSEU|nr:MoaD/ThiS family protein [Amycolatopsis rhizosphaerae]TVT61463.1 MoaD/ThiS family protein [Amycolatopsis rhizosphaerae]
MPHLIVPASWHNATSGKARLELPAVNLRELLDAFVRSHPKAGYRLYSPAGALLHYHIFVVDGVQVPRTTPPDDVNLTHSSRVEIIPPLVGG